MTTDSLDHSDSRRLWTRPALRRLSGGGQAQVGTFDFRPEEGTITVGGSTYNVGPPPS